MSSFSLLEEHLQSLTQIPSPVNDEAALVGTLERFLRNSNHFKTYRTPHGSLLVKSQRTQSWTKTGLTQKRRLIDLHLDTTSLRVTHVDPETGLVTARSLGFNLVSGQASLWEHVPTQIQGVSLLDGDHYRDYDEGSGVTKSSVAESSTTLTLRFPQGSEEIQIGDSLVPVPQYVKLSPNVIGASGLDNRASVAVTLTVIEYFETYPNYLGSNVDFYFSTREEAGLGDLSSVYGHYDEIYILDAVPTTPLELREVKRVPQINLGRGVYLTRDPEDNRILGQRLGKLAKDLGLEYQFIYSYGLGASNSRLYSKYLSVPVQQINFPIENIHGSIEVVDLRDLKTVTTLLISLLMDSATS